MKEPNYILQDCPECGGNASFITCRPSMKIGVNVDHDDDCDLYDEFDPIEKYFRFSSKESAIKKWDEFCERVNAGEFE